MALFPRAKYIVCLFDRIAFSDSIVAFHLIALMAGPMNSFIFPEDLDPWPTTRHERVAATSSANPVQSEKLKQAFPVPVTRRRPIPIIMPSDVDFSRYLEPQKPKDEVVVSVTRLSLDERSQRLLKSKRPSNLTRWKSATLSKSDKDDRDTRMALAEAERAAQRQTRHDRAGGQYRTHRGPLSSLQEERRDGQSSPADYGVAHLMF